MSLALVAVFAALVTLYALTASKLGSVNVTGPMVFLACGMLAGKAFGYQGITVGAPSELIRVFTALALVLLLFSDASTIDLAALRRNASVPVRLLVIGLPITVAFGAIAAHAMLPGVDWTIAALIGAILAPTDLSLGLAMFENPAVPKQVARSINVESGLNDGIVAPLVTLFAAGVMAEAEKATAPMREALSEIALGVAVGVAVALIGGLLVRAFRDSAWSKGIAHKYVALALALLAYACALLVHGNGFIAAFIGGLAFGAIVGKDAVDAAEYAEETGTLMTLGVWYIFGLALTPLLTTDVSWQSLAYAAASLTVIRMIPVALCLIGSGAHRQTVLFDGWFGPRGLASVVFLLQVLPGLQTSGIALRTVAEPVGWTIMLSVVLHGFSAGPVANWYAKQSETFPAGSMELSDVVAVPTRRGLTRPSSKANA